MVAPHQARGPAPAAPRFGFSAAPPSLDIWYAGPTDPKVIGNFVWQI